jgi:hypothetical protein
MPPDESPPYTTIDTPVQTPPVGEERKMVGGKKREWHKNDPVFLVGGKDTKPNRLWRIKHLGDKFVTVETSDFENLEDPVKVVTPLDLLDPEEVIRSNRQLQQQQQNEMRYQQSMQQPPANVPVININPVMKVVNGDDKSTMVETEDVPPQVITPSMNYTSDLANLGTSSGENFVVKKDSVSVEEKKPANEIDFNKGGFMVKKV